MYVYLPLLVSLMMYVPVYSAQGVGHRDKQNADQRSWIEKHKKKALGAGVAVGAAVAAWQFRLRGELKKLFSSKTVSGTLFMNAHNNDHNNPSNHGSHSDNDHKSRCQEAVPLQSEATRVLVELKKHLPELDIQNFDSGPEEKTFELRKEIIHLVKKCKTSQEGIHELDAALQKSSGQLDRFSWEQVLTQIDLSQDIVLFDILKKHMPSADHTLVYFVVKRHFEHYYCIGGGSEETVFLNQLKILLDEERLILTTRNQLNELEKSFNGHLVQCLQIEHIDPDEQQNLIKEDRQKYRKACDEFLYSVFTQWSESRGVIRQLIIKHTNVPEPISVIIMDYLSGNNDLHDKFVKAQTTVRKELV